MPSILFIISQPLNFVRRENFCNNLFKNMKKIWKVKIRPSIKKEFPRDEMMQELHEIRARLSRKYKPPQIRLFPKIKRIPEEVRSR